MADLKISALTASTTPLAGTEVLPIVQSGTTKQVSVANLTAGRNVSMLNNTVTGVQTLQQDVWHLSGDSKERLYYVQNDFTIFRSPTTWQWRDATNGTRAELNATGNYTLYTGNLVIGTSGKGIDFSATPGTGTSELLADYEEGTWTVTDASGAGLTLVTATGFYTKIGRVVYWQANVDYPVTANGSNALLGGLPFTISEGASPGRSGSFITATTVATLVQTLQLTPTNVRLYKAGFVRATNAELSGSTIYLAGFYVV